MGRLRIHALPTPKELALIWEYNPIEGTFKWVVRGKGRRAAAGSSDGHYYVLELIPSEDRGRMRILAHRVAWALTHGEWPPQQIDHINGNKMDNRLVNLRLATPAQNLVNKPAMVRSLTGRKGVTRDNRDGRFYAYLDFEGKRQSLGGFDSLDAATEARAQAEILHYGEYSYYASSASSGFGISKSAVAKS